MNRFFSASLIIPLLFVSVVSAYAETKVGVAYFSKSGMSTRVLEGLVPQLKYHIPDVTIEERIELKDAEELLTVIKEFEQSKDAMIIMRSSGAKVIGKHPPSIPTFLGAVNNPVLLGVVDSFENPGGNVTGATYYLKKESQFDIFQSLIPTMKSVFLVVEKGHPSSPIDIAETEALCEKLGIAYNGKEFESLDEAIATIRANKDAIDVFILGAQSLGIDNADKLVLAAPNKPFVSYSAKPVQFGALGGFVANDQKLGIMIADSMKEALVDGKVTGDIPFKTDEEPTFVVNVTVAEKLGLQIPYEVLQAAEVIE